MSAKTSGKLIQLIWITILCCTILKLFGYNEFEIPEFNVFLNIWLIRFINLLFYITNGILLILIVTKRKLKFYEFCIILPLLIGMFIFSMFDILVSYSVILETFIYILLAFILNPKHRLQSILDAIIFSGVFLIYQILTMIYKNINPHFIVYGFIESKILQTDYYALILLTLLHEFKKGGTLYERGKTFLVVLSKSKSIKQFISNSKTPIQQNQKNNALGFKLFLIVLSLTQMFIVGTACYFVNNVILEYFIVIFSFFIMRAVFGKSYHADSVLRCTTLAIIVFVLATRLSLPLWASISCNIIIGCLVAWIMHIWYYYIKYTTSKEITIYKGMKLEDLDEICQIASLENIDYQILKYYYVDRYKLDKIAIQCHYSVDTIKKRKANALKKLKKI